MMNQEELITDPSGITLTGKQIVDEAVGRPPSSVLVFGPTVIASALVFLLVLAWFIEYPDVISGKAVITTISPPQKEIAKVSGIIDTIFVKDNQHVIPGTMLAIIENAANYYDVFKLKSVIQHIDSSSKPEQFPIEEMPQLMLGEISEDYSRFETAHILYHLNEELQPFAADSYNGSLNQKELNDRENTLNNQLQLAQSELRLKEQDLERYRKLYAQGVIPTEELELKELASIEAKRSVKTIALATSQLRESKNNNDRNLRNVEFSKTRENIQLRNNLVQAYFILKKSIKDWELKYVLQSKTDGRVSFLNYWSTNQRVTEGELLFAVIPEQKDGIVARVKTPSLKSGKVKPGQTVNLKLESYPANEFGIIKGKVSTVSVLPDEEGFYLVNVVLPGGLITTYNNKINFRQEMIGDAEIITEDRRLLERFFFNFKAIFTNS